MTAYVLTPAQHSQLVDALWTVIEHNKLHHGVENNTVSQCESALAMLKAMKPVEPRQWSAGDGLLSCSRYRSEPNYVIPLYAMETKT